MVWFTYRIGKDDLGRRHTLTINEYTYMNLQLPQVF
jgi:hypothetical protein